jgi:hypothetical protein
VEPKSKTFVEELGLSDSELSTKRHDSLVLWLLDKERMKDVILGAYPEVKDGLGHWASDFVLSDPNVAHRVVEFPSWDIVNERLSAEEMCAAFRRKHPSSSMDVEHVRQQVARLQDEARMFRLLEKPSVEIIGYVDFFVKLTFRGTTHFSPFKSSRMRSSEFFVEVRTKVNNVGALLKQIRTYMEFTKARPVLVAPVRGEVKKTIEAQGVPVFRPSVR